MWIFCLISSLLLLHDFFFTPVRSRAQFCTSNDTYSNSHLPVRLFFALTFSHDFDMAKPLLVDGMNYNNALLAIIIEYYSQAIFIHYYYVFVVIRNGTSKFAICEQMIWAESATAHFLLILFAIARKRERGSDEKKPLSLIAKITTRGKPVFRQNYFTHCLYLLCNSLSYSIWLQFIFIQYHTKIWWNSLLFVICPCPSSDPEVYLLLLPLIS